MFDILSAIYHDDPISPAILSDLEDPQSTEERCIATQLRAVKDEKAAEALEKSICTLANKQAERAFYSGARFGLQLAIQLLTDF